MLKKESVHKESNGRGVMKQETQIQEQKEVGETKFKLGDTVEENFQTFASINVKEDGN